MKKEPRRGNFGKNYYMSYASNYNMELNKEALIESYNHAESRRNDLVGRIWETAKFFTTIFSALTATTIALSSFKISLTKDLLLLLPIIMLGITVIGWYNLRREYKRFLEAVGWLKIIEKFLGLHDKITEDKRYFSKEEYLLPKRYVQSTFATFEEFIDDSMSLWKHKDGIFFTFTLLFLFYGLVSITIFFILLVSL